MYPILDTRVVFNGATFDGTLASGVASKGFMQSDDYYAYVAAYGYGYGGIYDGGMNLSLRTDTPVLRGRKIGCVLSQSINLTPFRQIIIDYRPKATMANNPLVSLEAFISRASDVKRGAANVQGVGSVDGLGYLKGIGNKGYQGQLILDVSDVNEHAFLAFTAKADISSNRQVFNGSMQITKIELIN